MCAVAVSFHPNADRPWVPVSCYRAHNVPNFSRFSDLYLYFFIPISLIVPHILQFSAKVQPRSQHDFNNFSSYRASQCPATIMR